MHYLNDLYIQEFPQVIGNSSKLEYLQTLTFEHAWANTCLYLGLGLSEWFPAPMNQKIISHQFLFIQIKVL